jgi:hypothetical protein
LHAEMGQISRVNHITRTQAQDYLAIYRQLNLRDE